MFGTSRGDEEPAIIDRHRTVTWSGFRDRVQRLLTAFDDMGLREGDVIAVLVGNRAECYELMAAAVWSGLRYVPLNLRLTSEEIAYVVRDSSAKAIFVDSSLKGISDELVRHIPQKVRRIVLSDDGGQELSYERLISDSEPRSFPADGTAGGLLSYTSGTTGQPKGVVRPGFPGMLEKVTLANVMRGDDAVAEAYNFPDGPHLVAGPLYAGSPRNYGWMALRRDQTVVIMDGFDAEELLTLLTRHDISSTHLVPTMFIRLLRLPDDVRAYFDQSRLKLVLHGAAPTSVPVKRAMIDWWGPIFTEYYGGTEGGLTTASSEEWLERPGTVGRAFAPGGQPTWAIEIYDEQSQRLTTPRTVGTVYFRVRPGAPGTFEYLGDPDKTARAHLAPDLFTLGDVGFLDEDDYLYLTGRASDMILSGGVNVYPAESEAVLAQHHSVEDVCVVGVPDEEWGEAVKAVVELKSGYAASTELADELLAFAGERLARYKVPRSVDFSALDRDLNGKLSKKTVRDRYWRHLDRSI